MHATMQLQIVLVAYIWMMMSIILPKSGVDCAIGMVWGRQSVTTLIPSMVVDLLLQNGINEVKLFNSDPAVIAAFTDTGIAVSLTIASNSALANENAVASWARRTLEPFPGVNFRYVSVGNNAFVAAKYANRTFGSYVQRLKLVQAVLDDLGYGDKVKAVITHSRTGVLKPNITLPSEAEFAPEVMDAMLDTLSFLEKSGVPFIFENFPISQIVSSQLDYDFAFSDDKSKYVITDRNGLRYNNLFDMNYDSFIWALRKVGYGNMKVVVGQIGWPTDGIEGAHVDAAERYWKALLPRVTSNRGTPMRPGVPIDVFIHSLTDEKSNSASLPFSRHWGIYRANGNPKYKIDLTGKGRDIFPTSVYGTNSMPARWCIFNEDTSDSLKVEEQFRYACRNADCTALAPGGSCGMLTYSQNISYAFNAYFQSNFQDERACQFSELSTIVLDNPSRDGCIFSVEVVRGNQPAIILAASNHDKRS